MKREIKNATAIYTGGNIYIYYGQLSDGNWFRAYDEWECIEICNADTSTDDADYNEFYEEHTIERLEDKAYETFWNEMLLWIVHNEPEGNYQKYELEKRIIIDEHEKAKLEMKDALEHLKSAWLECLDVFGNCYIDCNDYILGSKENEDEYPFHCSFDEINVVGWTNGIIERLGD